MPARFEGLMVGTPPPLCNSPTLEINGTQGAPHPAASQADAYLFQVKMVITNQSSWWWWRCRWNRAGPSSIARLCVTRGSGEDPTVGRPGRGLEVIIINTITPIPTIRISLTIARKGKKWKKNPFSNRESIPAWLSPRSPSVWSTTKGGPSAGAPWPGAKNTWHHCDTWKLTWLAFKLTTRETNIKDWTLQTAEYGHGTLLLARCPSPSQV